MLDAPDRCSRIHGRTALHSQRINLSANHAVFQDHAVPAIRVQAAVDRQWNLPVEILQRDFVSKGIVATISIASLYTEGGFLHSWKTMYFVLLLRQYSISRGMFFAVSATSLPGQLIYAQLSAVVLITIPALFVYFGREPLRGYLCFGQSRECGNSGGWSPSLGGSLAKESGDRIGRILSFVTSQMINRLLSRDGLIYLRPRCRCINIEIINNFISPFE